MVANEDNEPLLEIQFLNSDEEFLVSCEEIIPPSYSPITPNESVLEEEIRYEYIEHLNFQSPRAHDIKIY